MAKVLALIGLLALAGAAWAQAPAGSGKPITSPLPGDVMRGPPKGGLPAGAPPKEVVPPSPPLAVALAAAQAALDQCKADGFGVAIVVLDSSGQPRAALAADSETGGHVYTATRKGLATLAFGVASSKIDGSDPKVTPGMIAHGGAVPLLGGSGKLMGAIASSGAPSTEDEKCAQAGADAVRGKF